MPRKLVAALLFLVPAAPLAAQSTLTPVFHAPYRVFERYEIGANVSDAGNIAIEGFYGFGPRGERWDVGLRLGVLDRECCRAAVLAGVDARFRVIDQNQDFPLDGSIITGAGAQLASGGSVLFIPIGISLGHRFHSSNSQVSLVPYAEPVLGPVFGNGDTDLVVALGLGADLRLTRRLELRASVGIGDIENFAIGFAVIR